MFKPEKGEFRGERIQCKSFFLLNLPLDFLRTSHKLCLMILLSLGGGSSECGGDMFSACSCLILGLCGPTGWGLFPDPWREEGRKRFSISFSIPVLAKWRKKGKRVVIPAPASSRKSWDMET